jgi:peptidoglycan/xylan/chitin deacetylase (PgdA/CDA1 family)
VSLTYDDALPIHYEHVGPSLEAHGLRGTFYAVIGGDPLRNFERWRALAAHGHELGNHTLFHPCRRCPARRFRWLDKGFDLRNNTPRRLQLELRVANAFLHLLDGKAARTYGNTCSDLFIGRGWNKRSIGDLIRDDFVAARGAQTDRMAVVSRALDLMNVGHCVADGRKFHELRDEICAARDAGGWLVYVIHGIGAGTHDAFVEREIHEQLLGWLASQEELWVQPFVNVATRVRDWQQKR